MRRVRRSTATALLVLLVWASLATVTITTTDAAEPSERSPATPLSTLRHPEHLATYLSPADQGGDPGPAARAITVTPSTDLVDGQTVNVVGTGFGRDDVVGLLPCAAGLGLGGCDLSGLVVFGQSGSTFDVDYRVRAVLHTSTGDVDCRSYAPGCTLTANGGFSLSGAAIAPLSFDPDGPLEPAPKVVATPAANLVDGQVIDVTGTGFHPDEAVLILQCPADVVGTPDLYFECVGFAVADTDADGDMAGRFRVSTIVAAFLPGLEALGSPPLEATDCRVEGCVILATSGDDFDHYGTTAIGFDPHAPLLPPRGLTVTPDHDLADGQVVQVDITGNTADAPVDLVQCAFRQRGLQSFCDLAGNVSTTADASGRARAAFTVAVELHGSFNADCRVDSCSLVAFDGASPPPNDFGFISHQLGFVPAATPPDPAEPTPVEPRFTG